MILQVYQGVSSGSYMGRDDGYPETKLHLFNDLAAIVPFFGRSSSEQYYELTPIDSADLSKQVEAIKAIYEADKKEKQRQLDLAEFERLSKKLSSDA
jgi:hypothetical protein